MRLSGGGGDVWFCLAFSGTPTQLQPDRLRDWREKRGMRRKEPRLGLDTVIFLSFLFIRLICCYAARVIIARLVQSGWMDGWRGDSFFRKISWRERERERGKPMWGLARRVRCRRWGQEFPWEQRAVKDGGKGARSWVWWEGAGESGELESPCRLLSPHIACWR